MRACPRLVLAALLALGAGASLAEPPEPRLLLAGGEFRPLAPRADPPAWLDAAPVPTSAKGMRYLVAIARGPLRDDERQRLVEAGAELLGYLPEHGYHVRLLPGAEPRVRDLPFLAWLGELPAEHKIEPSVVRAGGEGRAGLRVRVVVAGGEPADRVLDALGDLALRATPSGKDGAWRIEAELRAGAPARVLGALAALPEVEAVESVRDVRPDNQDAVWVHQSFVGPSPQQTPIFDRGIFGCGEVVAVADTGQDYDLCYFSEPAGPPPILGCTTPPCPAGTPAMTRRKDILYYNWSGTPPGDDDTCPALVTGASGHGTHTSGAVAADALPWADCTSFLSPERQGGDGLAPGAKLVIQEMGDGVEYLNNLGGSLWNLADVAFQTGARIHSDSWSGSCVDVFGDCVPGCTMPYDSFARDADLAMWTHPDLLLVLSAGNAGVPCNPPVEIGTPAIAKNPIAVGATNHGSNAGTVPSFSSRGPVFDGRLKPTLAAQGVATVSAASDPFSVGSCDTCSLSGTSMAAPTVAGLAAQVREYYRQGFHVSGVRDPSNGFTPSAALLKATLVDAAAAPGAPNFVSGYGRVQLDRTLAFSGSPFDLRVDDHRQGIGTGGLVQHAYDVSAGTPFRATLVWSDYPASLLAATARVNELKLEVVDPGGTVWFQTRDAGTGAPLQTSDAGAVHDTRNVEERLVFATPTPGRWIVRVRGVAVPWGPQPFALVVRGAVADCPPPASPGSPSLTTPADAQVGVSWPAVPGAAAYNVYRSYGACPGGPWTPVALGLAGTSFLDTTVSGGAMYGYRVVATSDAAAACESPPSECSQVVPSGDCLLTPEFRGITGTTTPGTSDCTVTLQWNAGRAFCVGDLRYNVYRGTSPGFPVDAAHRVARCVVGTQYPDSVALVHGTTYHYVVRAEDATAGHGGPCRGGNEESNVVEATGFPEGPPVPGSWSDDAGDTSAAAFGVVAPWSIAPGEGTSGSAAYEGVSSDGVCAALTSPVITLDNPAVGPLLTFATAHNLEYDPGGDLGGSLGQVEIAVGPTFSNWTRVSLTPDYPAFVATPFNFCETTVNPDTYFSGNEPAFTTYSGSLADWGGRETRLRFQLSGDFFLGTGSWWIDDVTVSGAITPGSCTTSVAGPPPVPDGGSVPGQPLRVAKSGANLLLTWDAASCPAQSVNVYRGTIGAYASFTGGYCDLPATGSATLAVPDGSWFLVVATDGATTDGSWSRNGAGDELNYSGAAAACPAINAHVTNNACP